MSSETKHCKIIVTVTDDFDHIDESSFDDFVAMYNGPIFYRSSFLKATHKYDLLPIDSRRYLWAHRGEHLVGFTPSYRMKNFDPFGVLQTTSGILFPPEAIGWLSHIMHFYESTIVCNRNDDEVREHMLNALYELCVNDEGSCCGIINVVDEPLIQLSRSLDWKVSYMWDRYYIDFSEIHSMLEFYATLDRYGRNEIRRQVRKFEESNSYCQIFHPPFSNLEEIAELCFLTIKKNGTPQYYPAKNFKNFVESIGESVLIFGIFNCERLVGALVCFEKDDTLHLWAGGMIYDHSSFSPYTMLFYHAYEYVIKNKLLRLEAGRTNKKIKERLGFKPKALYSILKVNSDKE
ncbi:MAG: GNAT family N-acetyltransferase [Chitinophagaceae bacterium]|nr:MAG: GNAT family N-acetyltransferase [Chitinophagaceae bacterium]